MLVLTRKKDEQIRIGDDIIITVIRVKGKSVRLGIQAPRTEPVLRAELEFREPGDGGLAGADADADTLSSGPGAPESIPPRERTMTAGPLHEFYATMARR